jgi:hypothetical protein
VLTVLVSTIANQFRRGRYVVGHGSTFRQRRRPKVPKIPHLHIAPSDAIPRHHGTHSR